MKRPSPALMVATVVAYVIATFAVQAPSHLLINAEHYAGLGFLRPEPIFVLGFIAMLIQGAIFAFLFPLYNEVRGTGRPIRNGLHFAWIVGAFLASYMALAEPDKYLVPSIAAHITVETLAAFCQFTLFGLLLGLIHVQRSAPVGGSASLRASPDAHP